MERVVCISMFFVGYNFTDLLMAAQAYGAMLSHRALSIPDVVYLVLHEVRHDRPALASSARCCRAFHEPAIDLLWRDLDSFVPLRNLLPCLSLTDERNLGAETAVSAYGRSSRPVCLTSRISQGRPSLTSLQRFQHYARRVRSWVPEKDGSDTCESIPCQLHHGLIQNH